MFSMDSLYPAYTADPILHLAQSLNPTTDRSDGISVVTVAGFEVPSSQSEKFHPSWSHRPDERSVKNDLILEVRRRQYPSRSQIHKWIKKEASVRQ